ncbi:RE2, partial [Symbiodinium pilosum]
VELTKEGPNGMQEQKFNVLTAVDYASDFAQQILTPAGPCSVSKAFHDMWCRPYGPPKVVYVDPDQRWMSGDFQKYLRQNSITLLDSASESHWQLGRVEIAQKILRRMAQRREPPVPGSLADVTEQNNDEVAFRHLAREYCSGQISPRGQPSVRHREGDVDESPSPKNRRVAVEDDGMAGYSPSIAPDEPAGSAEPVPLAPLSEGPSNSPGDSHGPEVDMPPSEDAMCCEISLDVFLSDIRDDASLWQVLEECAMVTPKPGQKRRVEVVFPKLGTDDQQRFRQAMCKEWQSWLENKESKHVILSICASKGWVIWGADIKTAFLSGDASNRDLFFKPPKEVQEIMGLEPDDVLRLEKAAYGLAEAPRAWFLRLPESLQQLG